MVNEQIDDSLPQDANDDDVLWETNGNVEHFMEQEESLLKRFTKPGIPLLIVILILLASIGGSLFYVGYLRDDEVPEHGIRSPQIIEHTMNIHIVLVGFEDGVIDEQTILDRVPTEYRPMDTLRSYYVDGFPEYWEPQKFYYSYEFHTASDEFAQAYFDAANSFSEWGDLGDEGRAGYDEENYDYLKQYDLRPGSAHARNLLDDEVQFIDVIQLELWIDEHEDDYDLDFGVNSYTYYIIDSYSRMEEDFGNVLPVDRYHYYKFSDYDWGRRGIHTMRTWGGDRGFLWIDVGAAPNFYEVPDDELAVGSADDDPPIWDIGNIVPGYLGTFTLQDFNDNMAKDFHFALNFRFSPSYIYHPEYAPEYYMNVHVYYEDGVMQDERVPLDMEEVLDRLRQSFPWCTINGEAHVYDLPTDDPGMYQAIEDGNEAGGYTYCDATPIIDYVETHRDEYYNGPEDAFDIFAGFVQFEDDHYAFAAPLAPQGVAMYSPDGTPWGILCGNNEMHRRTEDGDAPGEGVFPWNSVAAHEAGHFFGLHHPHDGILRHHGSDGTDGEYESTNHWLWDQSYTIMSYRTHSYRCDVLDMDHLARGHIMENTNDARRNIDIVYEMLLDTGEDRIPREYREDIDDVLDTIDESIGKYRQGKYMDGVRPAEKALERSEKLMNEVADDVGSDLHAVRIELDWEGAQDGSFTDYQQIDITTEMEYIDIAVYWNNTGSAADLFVGYTFQSGTDGAVYDYYHQGSGETDCVEQIRIDLEDDGIRDAGVLHVGTGSRDDGNDVPYHVIASVEYRESGLYWEENGIESF